MYISEHTGSTGRVARRALIGWCRLIRFFMVFDFFVERIERGLTGLGLDRLTGTVVFAFSIGWE